MKQKIDPSLVADELRNGSVFFQRSQPRPQVQQAAPARYPQKGETIVAEGDTTVSRFHDTTTPRYHDTTPAYSQELIEKLRSTVKHIGKEAATHRFTIEEKRALKRIEFEYLDKGIQTSENEITRIAVNFLLEDYRVRKEHSLIAKILILLNT